MNEPKSSRYHRLRRRAGFVAWICTLAVLVAFLRVRPDLPLWQYVLALVLANELFGFPIALYRGFWLERRYDLSLEPFGVWLKDHLKGLAIGTLIAIAAAEFVYALIRWSPSWWWLPAAAGAAAFSLLLVWITPVILLPLFYRFTPLERPPLRDRLVSLSSRAGVPVLGVYEWAVGDKTRRANAALTGSGSTRRILLSDTLLAEYTDDEIEVILAHELAHHVHRDIPKALAFELALLLAAFYAASVTLRLSWQPLGLAGPSDPRTLPLLVLAGGAVPLAATPLLNALSRWNERRADRFALELTRGTDAFVSAMRRLGSQNLSEENPSRTALWLFHTHPPIEERIAMAKERGAEG